MYQLYAELCVVCTHTPSRKKDESLRERVDIIIKFSIPTIWHFVPHVTLNGIQFVLFVLFIVCLKMYRARAHETETVSSAHLETLFCRNVCWN